jgi:hypothetical protein
MLPKKGDIVRVDAPCEASPITVGRAGGFREYGKKEFLVGGTLLRFNRTKNDVVMVQIINTPKVWKMIKNINPGVNTRQSYVVDSYSISFHCKKEDFKWPAEKKVAS